MSDHETTQTSGDEQPGANQRPNDSPRGGRDRNSSRRHQNQTRRSEPMLPMNELRDLVKLIGDHGFTEFEFERQDFRVRLRRELAPQIIAAPAPVASSQSAASQTSVSPVAVASHSTNAAATGAAASAPVASSSSSSAAAAQSASAEAEAAEEENLHVITSPIVGTFYRTPSPTAEPFVRIGSHVSPETIVCIIEAMKLMNEIQAETSGEVVKIYVENAQPVEYGQPLFGIRK